MALTEKMKTDQKERLNKVVMGLRHTISEAVDNNEISKVESLIALDCIREEVIKSVLVPSKLPAPTTDQVGNA